MKMFFLYLRKRLVKIFMHYLYLKILRQHSLKTESFDSVLMVFTNISPFWNFWHTLQKRSSILYWMNFLKANLSMARFLNRPVILSRTITPWGLLGKVLCGIKTLRCFTLNFPLSSQTSNQTYSAPAWYISARTTTSSPPHYRLYSSEPKTPTGTHATDTGLACIYHPLSWGRT